MRCRAARKRLSDELDGALTPGRKAGLEAHLKACPDCREYRKRLDLLQAGIRRPADRPDEYWAGFEKRLEAKLSRAEPAQGRRAVFSFVGRKWAWAAAGALVIAAAWIGPSLLRPGRPAEAVWVPYEEALTPLLQEAEADPELERDIDREILASIEELMPALEEDIVAFPVADPLFWEGLSEDELSYIASALEKEFGLGGPR